MDSTVAFYILIARIIGLGSETARAYISRIHHRSAREQNDYLLTYVLARVFSVRHRESHSPLHRFWMWLRSRI